MTRPDQPSSISVVVPCYNEEDGVRELHRRVSAVLKELGAPHEIVLVDDGSKDGTWKIMQELKAQDSSLKAIKLSRNHGHQLALSCGLDQAKGQVVVVMDADLQDPPELIPEMLKLWREGFDVVYGKRKVRHGEGILKRFFAFAFYRIFRKVTGFELPSDTGDFRLMDRRAVDALIALRERHRFIRGMVSWIGFKQTPLLYERPPRYAGDTKYPFRKSFFLAIDAITSFSFVPLRLASYLGVGVSIFAFIYIIIVIILKFMGINFPGYTSIMATVLLLGGVQLVVLGIMGEYVGRIFEQGQRRPLYLIDQVVGEPLEPNPTRVT
ncbi:MAG: glycosyltransferase [Proteobacteria bacterium]|nr:MAG: glycosyltransferase [Pseudomonadota bacterium]